MLLLKNEALEYVKVVSPTSKNIVIGDEKHFNEKVLNVQTLRVIGEPKLIKWELQTDLVQIQFCNIFFSFFD